MVEVLKIENSNLSAADFSLTIIRILVTLQQIFGLNCFFDKFFRGKEEIVDMCSSSASIRTTQYLRDDDDDDPGICDLSYFSLPAVYLVGYGEAWISMVLQLSYSRLVTVCMPSIQKDATHKWSL